MAGQPQPSTYLPAFYWFVGRHSAVNEPLLNPQITAHSVKTDTCPENLWLFSRSSSLHFFFHLKPLIGRTVRWSSSRSPEGSCCVSRADGLQAPCADGTSHPWCPVPALRGGTEALLLRADPRMAQSGSPQGMTRLLSNCKWKQLLYLCFIPQPFLTFVSACIPVESCLFSPLMELI